MECGSRGCQTPDIEHNYRECEEETIRVKTNEHGWVDVIVNHRENGTIHGQYTHWDGDTGKVVAIGIPDYKCSDWCRFPKREHLKQVGVTSKCTPDYAAVSGWELTLLLEEVRNNK